MFDGKFVVLFGVFRSVFWTCSISGIMIGNDRFIYLVGGVAKAIIYIIIATYNFRDIHYNFLK